MVEASEAAQSGDLTQGAFDPLGIASPAATLFRGYCAECGTWDDHDTRCRTCGYAFTGTPVWVDPDVD